MPRPVICMKSRTVGMFGAFTRQPALSVVIFSEDLFRYDRRLSREVTAVIELTHDSIYRALREGARAGEVRSDVPARQLAWMVMGTMRLLITKWRISGYRLDLVKEGRQAVMYLRKVMAP